MRHTDFIVRDCGRVGFLPIILGVNEAANIPVTLYRGSHHSTREAAFAKMAEAWDSEHTSAITDWKALI